MKNELAKKKSELFIESVRNKLKNDGYKVIPNFAIFFKGKLIRINLIAINRIGIYLITTKNLDGVLTGNYRDKVWKIEYDNGKTYELRNTMKALYVPQLAVMDLLVGFDVRPLTTTIFSDKTDIKLQNAHPYSILKTGTMKRFFKNKFKERLNDDEVEEIYEMLAKSNQNNSLN